MARDNSNSIIVLDKFIQATRDSGYKGTASAVAELVDNSIQAQAKNVYIMIGASGDVNHPIRITVADDGVGMDKGTLRQALRFGGSSRFNDRGGLGRYGMGLPNSSLSQARRVEVYTWQKADGPALFSYLDVDDIVAGKMIEVPEPKQRILEPGLGIGQTKSGTAVIWWRCDRLSFAKPTTLLAKLHRALGQTFRHFLWNGVAIEINGESVEPVDPLFLKINGRSGKAIPFGEPMTYEVRVPAVNGTPEKSGFVTVRFAELPVHQLHSLTNEEKRAAGISNGAGVSVVRGGREVDYGWFFMGSKRRENYDDWWRAEVSFDPVLDEAFGITHTKQQIRPQEGLARILEPDMETTAKALNGRVRDAHLKLKAVETAGKAEKTAIQREARLEPLPKKMSEESELLAKKVVQSYPALKPEKAEKPSAVADVKILVERSLGTTMFSFTRVGDQFLLLLNPDHPFYRKVYEPLQDKGTADALEAKAQIDMLLLAAARAEAALGDAKAGERNAVADNRKRWSDILATYLNR